MLPLGASINMDGTAIYLGICAVFFSQLYGIPIDTHHYFVLILTATLGSIGAAGIPGGSLIMMGMVLTSVGLPLDGIALIAGVDRILDMLRTTAGRLSEGGAIAISVAAKEPLASPCPSDSSAAARSRVEANRSSGRLARARKQTASSEGCTSRCREGGTGSSDTCWSATPSGLSATNGARPASKW